MKFAELEKLYSFQESEVIDVRWRREYRDLVIEMRGIWHQGESRPAYGTPVKLTLRSCIWAEFDQAREFCESRRRHVRASITVIGWSNRTDSYFPFRYQDDLAEGYEFIEFESETTIGGSWLSAICNDFRITVGKRPKRWRLKYKYQRS